MHVQNEQNTDSFHVRFGGFLLTHFSEKKNNNLLVLWAKWRVQINNCIEYSCINNTFHTNCSRIALQQCNRLCTFVQCCEIRIWTIFCCFAFFFFWFLLKCSNAMLFICTWFMHVISSIDENSNYHRKTKPRKWKRIEVQLKWIFFPPEIKSLMKNEFDCELIAMSGT